MADNLTVKEISELNNVSMNDDALVLAYTDADGVGKTTFKDAKNYIGCNIDIEQTENAAESGGTNKIKATVRNGTETETKEFTYKNGNGLNSVTKTESTDTNGLKSNTVQLKSNDASLIPDVSFTVKDGVGVKSSGQTTVSTLSGELNEYTITLTDGTTNTIKVYNGRAGKDFRIKKTYTSISEMESDFSNTEIETYDFAMIDTGSVNDEDTGKLYYKNTDAWTYVGDLSGAQGVKGETGNGIASIENTLTDNGKIKVIITMTDGTTTEFLINNGLEYTAGNGIAISESNVVSVSDDIKTQIGLDKVDNTADSEKSVKYATSAGSATTATTASSASTCTGNSATATKLATARSISITDGTNTGTATNFDGSSNVKLNLPSTVKATSFVQDGCNVLSTAGYKGRIKIAGSRVRTNPYIKLATMSYTDRYHTDYFTKFRFLMLGCGLYTWCDFVVTCRTLSNRTFYLTPTIKFLNSGGDNSLNTFYNYLYLTYTLSDNTLTMTLWVDGANLHYTSYFCYYLREFESTFSDYGINMQSFGNLWTKTNKEITNSTGDASSLPDTIGEKTYWNTDSGKINCLNGLVIPTSQPETLANGDIWIG